MTDERYPLEELPELFTAREASEIWRCSYETALNVLKSKSISGFVAAKRSGKTYIFARKEVETYG